jgi:hypothetical protein
VHSASKDRATFGFFEAKTMNATNLDEKLAALSEHCSPERSASSMATI